jgi:hypothetical protein
MGRPLPNEPRTVRPVSSDGTTLLHSSHVRRVRAAWMQAALTECLLTRYLPLRGKDVSCVCGFRWPSFLAPATALSLSFQTMRPRFMSDS